MSSVDSRVVEARFDNAQFERGVRTTLESLANLNKSLQLQGATKGLENVSAASGKISFAGAGQGLDSFIAKFNALNVVATTVLATLVNQLTNVSRKLVSEFSFTPALDGFREYETKLGSIQTILANTARYGTTLPQVNAALDELNKYSDKTIYNFGQMTQNIGKFTNAGLKLEDSVAMIKGFSNAAAASGANATEAAEAAYQLSQALNSGTIRLMDWRSLSTRGIGNKNMSDGLFEIAVAMGKVKKGSEQATSIQKNFNASLESGWLTADIMSSYLKILAESNEKLNRAQLKAIGITGKQADKFILQQKNAEEAATKVRTLTQLMGTLKESIGSGWSETFQNLFGDFKEATDLFTNVNNVLGSFVQASAKARNDVIEDWKKLGGRTVLIEAISIAFKNMIAIVKPIRDAFREIFPKKTGQDLYNLTLSIRNFAQSLKIGDETAANLKRTFAGAFAIFSIGGQVISGIFDLFQRLFGAISDGSGGVLDFTGNLGDWLVSVDAMLKKSGGITKFFESLGDILAVPAKLLKSLADIIGNLFDSFDPKSGSQLVETLDGVEQRLEPITRLGRFLRDVFEDLGNILGSVGRAIGEALGNLGDVIAEQLTPQMFSKSLSVINTALLGGVFLLFKRFFSGGINVDVGNGFLDTLRESFGALTETLQTMQQNLKANILLKIAAALALITASIVVLGTMDSKDLAKGMAALAIGFIGLQVAMTSLAGSVGLLGAAKLPLITTSLIALSAALLLMSLAVRSMAQLEIGDMLRGLTGLGLALLIIGQSMKLMPKGPGMVAQAAALTILGVALNEIAIAVRIFASMQWDDMARGLTALTGALVALAVGMRLMPKGMLLQAAALTVLGIALNEMALALKIFNTMSWDDMAHGLTALAGAMVIIAGAMHLMPKGMLLQAAALVVVAGALNGIGLALKLMATMSWEEIGKGLVTLGGSLLILAGGLYLMSGAIGGAAALLVAAGALAILTPVLVTLGNLDISTIAAALGTLAGVFVILGVAGYALAGSIPTILGLGVALLLVGAGLALAGAGALAFAAAFGIVVAAGAAGVAVLAGILATFVDAIPLAIEALGLGLVALAKVIAENEPAFRAAINTVLTSVINAVVESLPKVANMFRRLIETAARILEVSIPRFARAGLNMIIGILDAIADKLPDITTKAADVVVAYIRGIGKNLPKIIDAGAKMIIDFLNGVAQAIRDNDQAMVDAGANIAKAIVEGMITGLSGAGGLVADAAKGVAKSALNAAKDFLGIKSPSKEFEKLGVYVNQGFAQGMKKSAPEIQETYNNMRDLLRNAMKAADEDVKQSEARLEKLTKARKKDNAAIKETQEKLAQARKERVLSSDAYRKVTQDLDDENAKLKRLANRYDQVTAKLDAAQSKLRDATKTRDDYKASIKDQFDDLPDISKDTKVTDYISELEKKVKDTQLFAVTLQRLRDLGLNDTAYKDLLAQGIDALPFAQELLTGGKDAVNQVNKLGNDLTKISGKLGTSASTELYQAGVDAAQGLVNGLKAQQKNIETEMTKISNYMVQAIKKALGIKSPSRVFMKVGAFTAQGLVKGLNDSQKAVGVASNAVGQEAIDRIKASMLRMSDVVGKEVDINPTIKPVLDLSSVRRTSTQLGSMFTDKTISVDGSYSSAKFVSAGYSENQSAVTVAAEAARAADVTFNQYNTSPKALTEAEIYRQTRNQISVAKGVLTGANSR